ncbi:MAG: T9SS type A sorting domain-containing protein [Candidatus Aegiribacteria sp.]|nr:T9SS type A sorting domain-containing protein [Candidatus Aegiribacteria sp.]
MKLFTLLIVLIAATVVSGEIVYRSPDPVEDVVLVESTDNSKLIEFNLSALESVEIELEGFGLGTMFRIPSNGGFLAMVGSPDMPVIRRMVLIPSSGNIELEIVSEESQYLGHYNVVPYQQPSTYSGGPSPYRIDNSVYSTSEAFPANSVELESINILRDVRVAWIRYNPVTVNPVTGDVYIVTSVVVNVKGIGGSGENELARCPGGFTRSFLRLYDEVIGFEPVMDTDVVDGSYVFIGTEESIAEAQDLISWKRQKGFNVEVGLLSVIGTSVSAIDSYLEIAFNTWPNPPEYVMLVGGDDVVPTPQYTGPPPYNIIHAADNQYAVVGSGVLPSMNIGRICGNNDTEDLAYISWKIHQNEMNPYQPGANWFMKGFSMGCTSPFCAAEESLMLHQLFQAHGIDSDFYCDALGGIPPSLSHVVDDLNEGRQVINYIGHGGPTSWVTTGFSNSHIAALTNGRMMPWVFTIGCQNGEFDHYYCFCEAFLSEGTIADPKGALAIMGSSTNTWIGTGDTLQVNTFRGYFTEEIHHLGAAHTWGKYKCDEYYGDQYSDDLIMMTTLFGCPETDIYNDTAPLPVMTNTHGLIQPGTFQVTVTDDSKAPVEGALVGAYYSDTDELLDSDYTNSSGIVNLTIPTIPGGNAVTITSTAHNMYPDVTMADQEVGIGEGYGGIVPSFFLNRPAPNPITSSASIEFGIPMAYEAELTIYDLSGRIITSLETGELEAGTHSLTWNGTTESGNAVPNGIYFMKLTAPSAGTITRSFLVVR